MVLKMRFENPEISYTKDLDPRECYDCDHCLTCRHKHDLDRFFKLLPIRFDADSGIILSWLYSWAVFCPFFSR